MKYRVWIHIEEMDESAKHYRDATRPVRAGVFNTLAEAETFVDGITAGVLPKPPNELLQACKSAEDAFSKFGESIGFGLMGPKCWVIIEELRKAIADFEQS
ncbi:MAG: hypothetical protein ACYSYV_10245 [Planctomycetota bacterium]|jgi:hypothetical protein